MCLYSGRPLDTKLLIAVIIQKTIYLADEVSALAEALLAILGRFGLGLAHLQEGFWHTMHKLRD